MDLDRLNQGEKIAGGAAIALFIVMWLFNWYSVDSALGEGSANAFEAFDLIDLILLLTVIAAIAMAVISGTGASVSLPIAISAVVTGLGALSTLLVFYRVLDPVGEGGVDRSLGIFLGLILVAVLTYGGYLAMQEEPGDDWGSRPRERDPEFPPQP